MANPRPSSTTEREIGIEALTELTLNVRWAWHHGTDELWAELDPELWALTHNPWVVLQTVSRRKLSDVLARPEYQRRLTRLVESLLDFGRMEAGVRSYQFETHDVAEFVGRSTFLAGRVEGPGLFRTEGGLAIQCGRDVASGRGSLALRPERLSLSDRPIAGLDNNLPGKVDLVSYLGAALDVRVRLSSRDRVVVQLPNRANGETPVEGATMYVGWPATAGLVFPEAARSSGEAQD